MSSHLLPIHALAVDKQTAERLIELLDVYNDPDAPAYQRVSAADEVMRILRREPETEL